MIAVGSFLVRSVAGYYTLVLDAYSSPSDWDIYSCFTLGANVVKVSDS